MDDKKYTYDIGKYTIGVDTNGEDGIGLTIAIIKNGEINFLGNCYGENARCIDLLIKENRELKNIINQIGFEPDEIAFLQQENAELKKQVENYKKLGFKYLQDKNNKLETQQKEFILYLRHLSNWYSANGVKPVMVNEILQKYKEIVGGIENENND